MKAADSLHTLHDRIRGLAARAAADMGLPPGAMNLLRLAHWLARQSAACADVLR